MGAVRIDPLVILYNIDVHIVMQIKSKLMGWVLYQEAGNFICRDFCFVFVMNRRIKT